MIDAIIDHAGEFGVARDQGRRPTCIAFAASDGHAHYRNSGKDFLSSEYLFYNAAQRQLPQAHHTGVRTSCLVDALAQDGQPMESHFPYQSALIATDVLPVPPNPFPHPRYQVAWTYDTFSDLSVATQLSQGQSIILAMNITDKFLDISPQQPVLTGNLDMDRVTGVHAVIVVGYGKHRVDGASYVKVRNSWGVHWGAGGYGWIPLAYASKQLVWAARLSNAAI